MFSVYIFTKHMIMATVEQQLNYFTLFFENLFFCAKNEGELSSEQKRNNRFFFWKSILSPMNGRKSAIKKRTGSMSTQSERERVTTTAHHQKLHSEKNEWLCTQLRLKCVQCRATWAKAAAEKKWKTPPTTTTSEPLEVSQAEKMLKAIKLHCVYTDLTR